MAGIDPHKAQYVEMQLFAVTPANIPCRVRRVKFFSNKILPLRAKPAGEGSSAARVPEFATSLPKFTAAVRIIPRSCARSRQRSIKFQHCGSRFQNSSGDLWNCGSKNPHCGAEPHHPAGKFHHPRPGPHRSTDEIRHCSGENQNCPGENRHPSDGTRHTSRETRHCTVENHHPSGTPSSPHR